MPPEDNFQDNFQVNFKRILERRETLSRSSAAALMQSVFAGRASELQLAALLGALAARAETPEEIAGFVDTMRSAATTLPLSEAERSQLVDTCGTGGDLSGTFNISTAAGLVAAAAGATIAKHGNRAVTSRCGSADVLEALGIPVNLSPAEAAAALRTHRFAFLHAPSLHPALAPFMPIRRALGVRTVFNILGPLSNPAGATAQVMGVYSAHLVPLVAQALALLGARHAFVVHGTAPPEGSVDPIGLDEISISGPTEIAEVRRNTVTLSRITPEQFGLERAPLSALSGGNALENAAILRSIFAGAPGPPRDIVLLNAAAVLVTAGLAPNLSAALALAARTIDTGAVTRLLTALQKSSP